MSIPFDNTYARLPGQFFAKAEPTPVPSPQLIRANDALAEKLGIDPAWLGTQEALDAFSGNALPVGAEPIAQAYAGHQFGGFSPQLGDGRAHLLGEVVDLDALRRDIQLKGSGQTPFSRRGDGKSALGPVLREYIVSEAMHALGIPTTRALAAVTTGETILRQEGYVPGGVFTRVASSHIRVGTFQYFLARNDNEALRVLADYTIARHYPHAASAEFPYIKLLEHVVAAQADLIAHWMSLGFIHGVMNTDNMSLSGETIDYGPCAFMDRFDPSRKFSFIDQNGRYAYDKQAAIAQWNLTRLAETLLPLLDEHEDRAVEIARGALGTFAALFEKAYHQNFSDKLGLPGRCDPALITSLLGLMADQEADFTLVFRHLSSPENKLLAQFKDPAPVNAWLGAWRSSGVIDLELMKRRNPIFIPRNHRIEEVIEAGRSNNFEPFHKLHAILQQPFTEQPESLEFEQTPEPGQIVCATFCGT